MYLKKVIPIVTIATLSFIGMQSQAFATGTIQSYNIGPEGSYVDSCPVYRVNRSQTLMAAICNESAPLLSLISFSGCERASFSNDDGKLACQGSNGLLYTTAHTPASIINSDSCDFSMTANDNDGLTLSVSCDQSSETMSVYDFIQTCVGGISNQNGYVTCSTE